MAVPFSNTKLRVPPGFQSLLEAVAKEILCKQPTDIISCAALYCDQLLKLRQEGSVDPIAQASDLQDRLYNNKSFQDTKGSDDEQLDKAAVTIQTKYRQVKAKEEVDDKRRERAATRIQAGYRGYTARKSINILRGDPTATEQSGIENFDDEERELRDLITDERDEEGGSVEGAGGVRGAQTSPQQQLHDVIPGSKERSPSGLKDDSDVRVLSKHSRTPSPTNALEEPLQITSPTGSDLSGRSSASSKHSKEGLDLGDPEVQRAAERIQAGYRGMKVRRDMHELHGGGQNGSLTPSDEDDVDDDIAKVRAATKIQAGYRGMKARQSIVDINHSPGGQESSSRLESPASSSRGEDRVPKGSRDTGEEGTRMDEEVEGSTQFFDESLDATEPLRQSRSASSRQEEEEMNEEIDEDQNAEAAHQLDDDNGRRVREVAAVKIQAGFRGMKVRKEFRDHASPRSESHDTPQGLSSDVDEISVKQGDNEKDETIPSPTQQETQAGDVDVDDTVRANAVTRIQAGVHGMQARQSILRDIQDIDASKVKDGVQESLAPNADHTPRSSIIDQAPGSSPREQQDSLSATPRAGSNSPNIEAQDDLRRREAAALRIQAGYRGWQVRRESKKSGAAGVEDGERDERTSPTMAEEREMDDSARHNDFEGRESARNDEDEQKFDKDEDQRSLEQENEINDNNQQDHESDHQDQEKI